MVCPHLGMFEHGALSSSREKKRRRIEDVTEKLVTNAK